MQNKLFPNFKTFFFLYPYRYAMKILTYNIITLKLKYEGSFLINFRKCLITFKLFLTNAFIANIIPVIPLKTYAVLISGKILDLRLNN